MRAIVEGGAHLIERPHSQLANFVRIAAVETCKLDQGRRIGAFGQIEPRGVVGIRRSTSR